MYLPIPNVIHISLDIVIIQQNQKDKSSSCIWNMEVKENEKN
jgi:hypothetical protein